MDNFGAFSHCMFDLDLGVVCAAEELVMIMHRYGMELDQIQGMSFNPFQQTWSLSEDLAVNYIAAFRHKEL